MSKRELERIAREIREIKAELNKSAVFPIYTSILSLELDIPHNKMNARGITKILMERKKYWANFDVLTRNMTKDSQKLWGKQYYAGKDKRKIGKIMEVKVLSFETVWEFEKENALNIRFQVKYTLDSDFIVV